MSAPDPMHDETAAWEALQDARADTKALRDDLKTILALCENPHWTADRRWKIAEIAQRAMAEIGQ